MMKSRPLPGTAMAKRQGDGVILTDVTSKGIEYLWWGVYPLHFDHPWGNYVFAFRAGW